MLEAVVKHDKDYFKNVYPDEASATQFEKNLTEPNKFCFYEMEQDVYIDADERVSIHVMGQLENNQNVKAVTILFQRGLIYQLLTTRSITDILIP